MFRHVAHAPGRVLFAIEQGNGKSRKRNEQVALAVEVAPFRVAEFTPYLARGIVDSAAGVVVNKTQRACNGNYKWPGVNKRREARKWLFLGRNASLFSRAEHPRPALPSFVSLSLRPVESFSLSLSWTSSVTSSTTEFAVQNATRRIDPRSIDYSSFSSFARKAIVGTLSSPTPTGFLFLLFSVAFFSPLASAGEGKLLESFRDLLEVLRIEPLEDQGMMEGEKEESGRGTSRAVVNEERILIRIGAERRHLINGKSISLRSLGWRKSSGNQFAL